MELKCDICMYIYKKCANVYKGKEMNKMANHKNARKLLRPKIKSEPEKQRESTSKSKYQLRPGLIDNKRINTIKTKRNEILRLGKSIFCISFARQIQENE